MSLGYIYLGLEIVSFDKFVLSALLSMRLLCKKIYVKDYSARLDHVLVASTILVIASCALMDLPPEKKNKGKSESKDKVELSCPWVIQASGSIVEQNYGSNRIQPDHANQSCIGTTSKRYQLSFSNDNISMANENAKKHVVGDYTKQYEVLRYYICNSPEFQGTRRVGA
uniref:Uncharacterized protein n=1 Tax=Lactuca sativa TaxID=4236 RepID=A0A9R1WUG9_LACSA|nr:hypothetical protein LSAT_V11C900459300 [Lactuca sativa]